MVLVYKTRLVAARSFSRSALGGWLVRRALNDIPRPSGKRREEREDKK